MESNGSHILPLPRWILILRGVQAVLALIIFCMACYGVSVFSFDGNSLILFTALTTMLLLAYIVSAELLVPVIYNYWAVLALDSFAVFFWIVSFPLLASEVDGSGLGLISSNYLHCSSGGICKGAQGLEKRLIVDNWGSTMKAAAALGGLEFALFVATLIMVSIEVHKRRTAGLGYGDGVRDQEAAGAAASSVTMEEGRVEMPASASPATPTAAATSAPVMREAVRQQGSNLG